MARRYSIEGDDTNTANTTILELRSTTAIRPMVYDILIGSDATPADNAGDYLIQRTSTAGTVGATVTPAPLDPGDPAATATAGDAHTAEPTYTSQPILLHVSLNQRATFRWVAAPMSELKLAASSSGLGLRVESIAGSAVNVVSTWLYEE